MDVVPVTQARSELSATLRRFRESPDAEPVVLGSHRKPEAALVPYAQFERAQRGPVDLEQLRTLAPLIRRLAAASHLDNPRVFGSVARGDQTTASDIDLLVSPAPEATLFDVAQFELDLELLLRTRVTAVLDTALGGHEDAHILQSALTL